MNVSPGPSFSQLAVKVHALLRWQEAPEALADFFEADLRRLSIYPRFVRNHALKFLNSNFVSLKAALSETVWKRLCLEYFEKHPPADWRLWKLAAAFPDFIRSCGGRDGLHSLHAELALFEWTELEAYHCPQPIPEPPDVKVPTLNPTLTALRFQCPTLPFIKHSRSASADVPASGDFLARFPEKQEEQIVFVFLHPESLLAAHVPASENLLFAFKIAHDGMDVKQASEAGGQAEENIRMALQNASNAGVIVLPENFSKNHG